ncbi:CAH9-like protein [Mya arenaria]|uniref:carbonic anhydrase n=1 Tax=Mya arenaria TaxID=6604 RepID=A0ABY7E0K6_MYAAR|nr:CAH9-like protein [Mya arenaria]
MNDYGGYVGDIAPPFWKDLIPENVCDGASQSPIDLPQNAAMEYDANLAEFSYHGYENMATSNISVHNNGHTVQLSILDNQGTYITGGGLAEQYDALQAHFHWGPTNMEGSEHTFRGHKFPLELHIVHKKRSAMDITAAANMSDGLAVLGFFFDIDGYDRDNAALEPLITSLENVRFKGKSRPLNIDFSALMPTTEHSEFYRYNGSLTTPTCNEAVVWTVFENKNTLSTRQPFQVVTTGVTMDTKAQLAGACTTRSAPKTTSLPSTSQPQSSWSLTSIWTWTLSDITTTQATSTESSSTTGMPLHIVHFKKAYGSLNNALFYEDGLAVIGVFFDVTSDDNDNYVDLISAFSDISYKGGNTTVNVNLRNLTFHDLGSSNGTHVPYFRYQGSLTTPPCFEIVTWTVLIPPIKISERQLEEFRKVYHVAEKSGYTPVAYDKIDKNYRPVQPLGARRVYMSYDLSPTAGASAVLVPGFMSVIALALVSMLLHS